MRKFSILVLTGLMGLLFLAPSAARADHTKTMSGKVRKVDSTTLVVDKPTLVSVSPVEFELNDATKKKGQLVPGMHIKVKYREEGSRKIAVEVETRPEFASKTAKEAAKQTQP